MGLKFSSTDDVIRMEDTASGRKVVSEGSVTIDYNGHGTYSLSFDNVNITFEQHEVESIQGKTVTPDTDIFEELYAII